MFKTQLDTFGNDFGHFWTFENFSIFWKHFEDSTLHGTLGKNSLQKKYPKTCSKHVSTIWEQFWAFLDFWKIFDFLKTFRRLDLPWNTGQEKISKKLPPKHVQNTFGLFWERIWAFLEFWKFFDFLKTFRRLDPPWNTGQKKFTKNLPKNMFKTRLDTFGNDFGSFWNFENFFDFLKTFRSPKSRPSMEHWAKKFFEKKYPQNVFKT